MMRSALVLGGTGFVGSFVVELLRGNDVEVISVARRSAAGRSPSARHVALDVHRDAAGLDRLIAETRPDCIIDLLGNRDDDSLAHLRVVHRLITTVAAARLATTLLLMGSAAEYGSPASLPVDERHTVQPLSDYGLTRAMQFWMMRGLSEQSPGKVVIARLFNVIGPGQPERFVTGTIVRQAVAMSSGRRSRVEIGRIDAARDFVDGRDVARALALLAVRGRGGEVYNVCSGRPATVEEVLRRVGRLCGLPDGYYAVSPHRVRDDVPSIYGSFHKLAAETGWRPEIDLDRSLADMVAFERAAQQVAAPRA